MACKEEHDDLLLAAGRYRDRAVTFLGVVYQDQPANVIAWLDEMARYDNLIDPGSQAAIDFGVFGVPETFFIDCDGTAWARPPARLTFPLLSSTFDEVLEGQVLGARRAPGWDGLELVPASEPGSPR